LHPSVVSPSNAPALLEQHGRQAANHQFQPSSNSRSTGDVPVRRRRLLTGLGLSTTLESQLDQPCSSGTAVHPSHAVQQLSTVQHQSQSYRRGLLQPGTLAKTL